MERRVFLQDVLTVAGVVGLAVAPGCSPPRSDGPADKKGPPVAPRSIAFRTKGNAHGPITRLVSPSDVGELIKPFVFLDRIAIAPGSPLNMGWHPHSGIATLTYIFEGAASYEETNGSKGVVPTGGIEWMRASGGVWHTGGIVPGQPVRGFQLWVAMPAALENGPNQSAYIDPTLVPTIGPARLLAGRLGDQQSPVPIPDPDGLTYLAVTLAAGQRWTYQPPAGHAVAWLAVHTGSLVGPNAAAEGELVVFAEGNGDIVLQAPEAGGPTELVLGSAIKHPHDLVVGRYSVHTNREALRVGEANIARIGQELRGAALGSKKG
jgi:redox-sensitive bicupin YhaK (pirin superfamily)